MSRLLTQTASLGAVCLYRLDQAAAADDGGKDASTYPCTVADVRAGTECDIASERPISTLYLY